MDDKAKFAVFQDYIREFGPNERGDIRTAWSPYHYTTKEGVVLGAWFHRMLRDHCQVGLFAAEDQFLYKIGSAVKWSVLCILTQAFHQTGRMEVRFKGRTQAPDLDSGFEPFIPRKVRHFAEKLGVDFAGKNMIADKEGRELYIRMTDLDEGFVQRCQQENVDLLQACLMNRRHIWKRKQVEFLFNFAQSPQRFFSGNVSSLSRLRYKHDLIFLRAALMDERTQNVLSRLSNANEVELESDVQDVGVIDYRANKDLSIDSIHRKIEIPAGSSFRVALLPRQPEELIEHWTEDASAASKSRADLIVVTRDYLAFGVAEKCKSKLPVVTLTETVNDLDDEIQRRLEQSTNHRGEPPEHHD